MNHVDAERSALLLRELAEYTASRVVTKDNLKELRKWVCSGHSVYENPWFIYGEDGWPLDYLAALEVNEDIEENVRSGGMLWSVEECSPAVDDSLD